MRWMSRWSALLLMGVAALGWHYRDRLSASVAPAVARLPGVPSASPPSSGRKAPPPPTRDVLYTWVDDHGVTHFEQRPGKGKPVVLDGSRITPLDPVDPGQAERVRQAAAGGSGSGSTQEGGASTRPGGLEGVRGDMAAGAHALKRSRDAASAQ